MCSCRVFLGSKAPALPQNKTLFARHFRRHVPEGRKSCPIIRVSLRFASARFNDSAKPDFHTTNGVHPMTFAMPG
jgi:hypothetical protein